MRSHMNPAKMMNNISHFDNCLVIFGWKNVASSTEVLGLELTLSLPLGPTFERK